MNKRILCSVMVLLMFLSLFIFPATAAGTASITAVYADGVVSVTGSGFENGAGYTLRVVDVVNSGIKAMGQTMTNGSGNISAYITTGVLNTPANYAVYVNSSNGQLAAADPSVETPADPVPGVIEATPVPGSNGTAKAIINLEDVEKALKEVTADAKGVKTVKIVLSSLEGVTRYGVELPAELLNSNKNTHKLEIVTPEGTLLVAGNTFKPGEFPVGSKVELSIGKADVSSLSSKDKADIGTRPVIDLNVKVNGEIYEKGNFKSPVTISIPYMLTATELKKPEHITVLYIGKNNKVNSIPNGKYDSATGMVTFTVNHFSKYAVTFVK